MSLLEYPALVMRTYHLVVCLPESTPFPGGTVQIIPDFTSDVDKIPNSTIISRISSLVYREQSVSTY